MIKTTILHLFILLVSTVAVTASEFDRRIVALGDLHGDLPNTLAILKFANIIDEDHHWIGGDAIFVQTVSTQSEGLETFRLSQLFYVFIG